MFVAWDEVKSRLVLSCRVRTQTQVDAAAVFASTREMPPLVMQIFCFSAGKAGAPCSDIVA